MYTHACIQPLHVRTWNVKRGSDRRGGVSARAWDARAERPGSFVYADTDKKRSGLLKGPLIKANGERRVPGVTFGLTSDAGPQGREVAEHRSIIGQDGTMRRSGHQRARPPPALRPTAAVNRGRREMALRQAR